MSFTDQKPRIATVEEVNARWGGSAPGKRFRCYLCGHKFQVGDTWRWVYCGGLGVCNLKVCISCDSPDVKEKWIAHNKEAKQKFWWFIEE